MKTDCFFAKKKSCLLKKKSCLLKKTLSIGVSMMLAITAGSFTKTTFVHAATQTDETLLTGITAANYPRVDGSTATLPLSAAIYSLVTGCTQKEADETIIHSKTTNSWLELIAGEKDLLIVADKNEKVDQAIAESGVELEIKPIALDAFVFMVNEGNPVQNLTSEQLVAIYSGAITNWSELGGEDIPIIPFQRNENAGSQTAMKSLVMKGVPMTDPQTLEIGTMMGLLESVASYNNEANAIGYSYYYYTDLMCQIPGLRYICVDGIEPNVQTIQSGEYPYIANYFAAIRKEEPQESPARRLYNWMTTSFAQELAADLGYVPLDASIQVERPHYESYIMDALPIAEDTCLILQTSDTTIQVIEQSGKIIAQFENASVCGQNAFSLGRRAALWKKEVPLPIRQKTGKPDEYGDDYKAGLYDLEHAAWIIEPNFMDMIQLSDTLYSEIGLEGGKFLIKTDGTIVDDMYYYVNDTYIYSYNKIRDKEGNLLFQSGDDYIESIRKSEETGALEILVSIYDLEAWTRSYALYDLSGTVLWKLGADMTLYEKNSGGLTWHNEEGQYVITDWKLHPLLSDESFIGLNPQYELQGEDLVLYQQDPLTQHILVGFLENNPSEMMYVCDASGHILECIPKQRITTLSTSPDCSDYTILPSEAPVEHWVYEKNEAGNIRLRDVFSHQVIDTDTKWLDITDFNLSSNHKIICLKTYTDDISPEETLFFTIDGKCFARKAGNMHEIILEDDLLLIESYMEDSNIWSNDYYTMTGELIETSPDGNIWYASKDLRCVQYGAYCYIEDADGKLYRRILCQDEEKDEKSWQMY